MGEGLLDLDANGVGGDEYDEDVEDWGSYFKAIKRVEPDLERSVGTHHTSDQGYGDRP